MHAIINQSQPTQPCGIDAAWGLPFPQLIPSANDENSTAGPRRLDDDPAYQELGRTMVASILQAGPCESDLLLFDAIDALHTATCTLHHHTRALYLLRVTVPVRMRSPPCTPIHTPHHPGHTHKQQRPPGCAAARCHRPLPNPRHCPHPRRTPPRPAARPIHAP